MDLPLIRELARLASVLELLKAQREVFSELSDIKEFRGLESDFSEALKVAQERRLVGQDPVSVVRADWQRMVRWSNRVQEALREVDELGQELSSGLAGQGAEAGRKRKKVQTDWKPSISQLRELEHALKGGPSQLTAVIDQARAEVQTEDWNDQWPYPELTEVAEAMGWGESLELAEPLGTWAEGVAPRARPLVATRMATEPGSPMLQRRIESMRMKLSQVRSLQEKHASHRTSLEEVGRLTEAGQVETARRLIGTLQAAFGDLDYSAREQLLAEVENGLIELQARSSQGLRRILELAKALEKAWFFGRTSARKVLQAALSEAAVLSHQLRQVASEKSGSEIAQKLVAWIELLEGLGVRGVDSDWAALRNELRLRAEADETVLASKLGLARPFAAGLRVLIGVVAVRWIPAGRFLMGSPLGETARTDETQYKVELSKGFFLAETQCTQGQWEAVMGNNPSEFNGSDRPVEQVSWDEAVEYCRKLTTKQRSEGILSEGWEWRLPTEAEWEYAARAGTTGSRHGELNSIAWYYDNSEEQTHPVKLKAPNAWELYDMMGNVNEWCSDWYGAYPTGSVTDPKGPVSGSSRVNRGACWIEDPIFTRSAQRDSNDPCYRADNLGFRPALSAVR
jgi:formylglycine-generating enzyme required for sulfatase activity